MKRSFPILAAVAAVAAGGWYVFGGTDTVNSTTFSPLVSSANAQTTEAADIDTSTIKEMTLGNGDSKVQVIEYASYTTAKYTSTDMAFGRRWWPVVAKKINSLASPI